MNRWRDWWAQSQRDLGHAEHALEDGDFEWTAFAARQAAEKGLKALILGAGGEPWGHSLALLVEALPASMAIAPEVSAAAHRLDKHYIPARYPNGLAAGYPAGVEDRARMGDGLPGFVGAVFSFPTEGLRPSQLDKRQCHVVPAGGGNDLISTEGLRLNAPLRALLAERVGGNDPISTEGLRPVSTSITTSWLTCARRKTT